MRTAASIVVLALACLLQAAPLSADIALAAPSSAVTVGSWDDLRTAIASGSDTVYDISALPDSDSGKVTVTRDVTLTAPGASGIVVSPEFVVSKDATLTLEDIELQGNEGIGRAPGDTRSATVRGEHTAGQYYGGSLVVAADAVLHAVPRPYSMSTSTSPAAMWLQSVQVNGAVQAELGGNNATRAVEHCASLAVDGGAVIGTDWPDGQKANGAVSRLISEVQDVTVVNGGTVRGNGDLRADASATAAISDFFTCTLDHAVVSNGPADYQEAVLLSGLASFEGADTRPRESTVDITDTEIEGRTVKSNRPNDGNTPFNGYTYRVHEDGSEASDVATSIISFDTWQMNVDADGAPKVTVRLHSGARIVGSESALGQGGWGICCYGGRVYVDAGASVVGGLSSSTASDVDGNGAAYYPTGGPAMGNSRVTVNGGSVSGGQGPTGGPAIVAGWTSSVNGGNVTGGASTWSGAGQAVYDTGTLSVTGGTLTGGSGPWYGGSAVEGVTNLALSGTGRLVGGMSSSDQAVSGAGVFNVKIVDVTGGSIEGGSSSVGNGGPGISAVRDGGSLSLADCVVAGGAGQKAGGAGIDAAVNGTVTVGLTATNSTISAGAGKATSGYGANGICNLKSASLEGCDVVGGACGVGGPGIWNVTGDVRVKDGSVKAASGSDWWGGNALSKIGGNLIVENALVEGGAGNGSSSSANGGNAVDSVAGDATFTGGSARGGQGNGGNGGNGLNGVVGAVIAEDAAFAGGEGKASGGKGVSQTGDLSLTNCTATGGKGATGGYGVYWTNATTAGTTSITGGTVTGGESTADVGATAVSFPAYAAGSTLALEGCTIEAGAGIAGSAPAADGSTGRGVNDPSGNAFACTVDDAVINGSSSWGFWAPLSETTVRGDSALIAGGIVSKSIDLEGGTVQPGAFTSGGTVASAVLAKDRFVMTGGAVKPTGDEAAPAIVLENADGFAAIAGGEVPLARGGIDIEGKVAAWGYLQENENTASLIGREPTSSAVRPLYAVTACASDGSALPETAVTGAGRSSIANPFDGDVALCGVDDAVVVTFDRALKAVDFLVVEARDWAQPGAPWVEIEVPDAVLSEANGVAQATFTVPARDVRVSLGEPLPALEADAVVQPDALAYGYEQGNEIMLTVKNAGEGTAVGLTAMLGQGASSSFEIVSGLAKDSLAPGETSTLRVRLKSGMAPADAAYADTLSVGGSNVPAGSVASFSFEQKVDKAVAVAAIGVVVEPGGSGARIAATLPAASAGAAKPTGSVSFYEDGALIAASALVDGAAICDYGKAVDEGLHTVTAVYSGDANYVAPATPPTATFDKHGQMQDPLEIVDPGSLEYGDAPFELSIAGGGGTGAVTFEVPADNGVLDVQGSTARIVGAGTVTVKAIKAGDATYNEAQAVRTVTVARREAQIAFAVPDAAELIEDGTIKEVAAHVENKADMSDDVAVVLSGQTAQAHGSYVATAVGLTGEHARHYHLPDAAPTQPWSILYIADKNENSIEGIKGGGIYELGAKVTFRAGGDGMHVTDPLAGDVRWLPVRWSVNPHGEFDPEGPFEATVDTAGMAVGEHTLTVVFAEQRFDGGAWSSTGEIDERTVGFTVVENHADRVVPESEPADGHSLPGASGSPLAPTGDAVGALMLLGFAALASAALAMIAALRQGGRR